MNDKTKKYMVYCEPCNYRSLIEERWEGDSHLTVIPTSKIQSNIPMLDPSTKKTLSKPLIERAKMYKCPKCGRGIRAKQMFVPYLKTLEQVERKEQEERSKEDYEQRIRDGMPLERTPDDLPITRKPEDLNEKKSDNT